jgi:hypothetical protein
MASPVFDVSADELLISGEDARALGARLNPQYLAAEPYPHVCLDDVFPEAVLDRVAQEIGQNVQGDTTFASEHENLKSQTIPERLPFFARSFMYMLNSRPFLGFLENLTGIRRLIPDPYFIGGGLHETRTGGYLDIHADFNHHAPMDLERRLNVLVYLNRDWKDEYGGCFEMWDTAMTKKYASVAPVFNRMVVFTTTTESMHGNPEPVNHPQGHSRRSIATYYYTATWDDTRREHSTIFRSRPGTDDASDMGGRVERFIDDVLPPIVNRQVRKIRRRIGV